MESKQVEDEVTFMKNFVFDDIDIEFIEDVQLYEYVTKDPNSNENNTITTNNIPLSTCSADKKPNKNNIKKVGIPYVIQINACNVCGIKYDSGTKLAAHMIEHYRIYKCRECDKQFATVTELEKHIYKTHRTFQCLKCSQTFSTLDEYSKHVLERNELSCDICCVKWSTAAELMSHKELHLALVCEKCNEMLYTQEDIDKHKILHEEIAECTTYDLTLDSDEENTENKQAKPEINTVCCSGPDTFLCPICGHNFKSLSDLEQHEIDLHKQVRPFLCMGCQMSFGSVNSFAEHFKTRRHMGNSKCNLCNEEFTMSSILINHVKVDHSS